MVSFRFLLHSENDKRAMAGDLREHRVKMVEVGFSRAKVEWATAVEVTLLILSWLFEAILKIMTPFKDDRG